MTPLERRRAIIFNRSALDQFKEEWDNGHGGTVSFPEYIGFSIEEYSALVARGVVPEN